MSDSDKPPSFEDLGSRIAKVRQRAGLDEKGKASGEPPPSGELGAGWRISIEIVVALALSTALGWALDQWFGTTPWLMLVFLFLGAAAGINNAVKTMNRMDRAAQEREQAQRAERGAGKRQGERGGD